MTGVPSGLCSCVANVGSWSEEKGANHNQLAAAQMDSATGQGAAFGYFKDADFAMLDALKIAVIGGDRPGSNYIAAELHMPVDEPNAVVEHNGWAIRFVEQGKPETVILTGKVNGRFARRRARVGL